MLSTDGQTSVGGRVARCTVKQMNVSPESKIIDTFPTVTLSFPASTQTTLIPEARGARFSETVCGDVENAAIACVPQV